MAWSRMIAILPLTRLAVSVFVAQIGSMIVVICPTSIEATEGRRGPGMRRR
jgi:hypothetical protein